MDARAAIRSSMGTAQMISEGYLGDLSDADLLTRPVPGANHIAWQLGHLIVSEHGMIEKCCPGSMPPLPVGFAEKYSSETSTLNDANQFHTKSEYLTLMKAQRAATLAALDKMSDADLDAAAPEEYRSFLKSVGDVFAMQGCHWMMHAGQWAVIRRKLNRPPLF